VSELCDYRMALHVHTRYTKSLSATGDIVASARRAGVDILLITDHNQLICREEGWHGWHDGTLVLVGDEVTPPGRSHVLAMGVGEIEGLQYLSERAYLRNIAEQGGLAILAHPIGKGSLGRGGWSLPWTHWEDPNYQAIEVWSYMHDWIDRLPWWRLPMASLRPHRRITGPSPALLGLWDRLQTERTVTGVGALDSHAVQVLLGKFHLFPFDELFRATLTHVLTPPMTGEVGPDEAAVATALRRGRAYVTFEILAPVDEFSFVAERGPERWLPISRLPGGPLTTFSVRAPRSAEIRLIRDSAVVASETGKEASWAVSEAGVYRVELHLEDRPWILSNPICIVGQ